jgi:hypothetical protein
MVFFSLAMDSDAEAARGFGCDFFGVFLLVVAIKATAVMRKIIHR